MKAILNLGKVLKRNWAVIMVAAITIIWFRCFWCMNYDSIILLNIDEKFNMITNVGVILSVVIAIFQFHTYKKEVREIQAKAEAEKAIEVAKEFADTIVSDMFEVMGKLQKTGLQNITNKISMKKMVMFNRKEMTSIFSKDDIKQANDIFSNIDEDTNNKINKLLNKLEYLCMYFNTKVANELTVYQSLHLSFLRFMKIIYIRIASLNEDGKDKLYTNIISLFNVWNERYFYNSQKEQEMIDETLKKIDEQILLAPNVKK